MCRKSPAVEQNEDLFLPFQAVPDGFAKLRGEGRFAVGGLEVRPHVDQAGFGERPGVNASGHSKVAVFPFPGVVEGLERRCGGAEHHHRPRLLSPNYCRVAPVVARTLLLLVGGIVFLVHHHQSGILQGSEHRRAGADHDPRVPALDSPPLVVAFSVGQSTVQDGYRVAQACAKFLGHPGGECDLRH